MKEGIIIYNGEEDEININSNRIKLIPMWRWLLNNSYQKQTFH